MYEHYKSVRQPAHVVAASAVFRADPIVTARMSAALDSLELSPDRYEILVGTSITIWTRC